MMSMSRLFNQLVGTKTICVLDSSTDLKNNGCDEQTYVSGFEKSGHFAPNLNFEILICSESIGNQLSFAACFMIIASWIHFLCTFI